ncbi:hypothetical protein B0H16DRAFT_1719761 [Mycena metata]|uniref:Uncharacterized protein n=1 Tax=Mycena metata TaxID=1033252 RepID=A0AAD7JB46_9AGAR|nr:hypothetical protein B0H16DRAFT_1719761 [Mycena metata]
MVDEERSFIPRRTQTPQITGNSLSFTAPFRRPNTNPSNTPPTTPQRPSLALLPSEDVDDSDALSILESFLEEDYGCYVGEERGITSIQEYIEQLPAFQVPATLDSISTLAPSVFASPVCEVLGEYYTNLHPGGTECCGFSGIQVTEIFLDLFSVLYKLAKKMAKTASAGPQNSGPGPSSGRNESDGAEDGSGEEPQEHSEGDEGGSGGGDEGGIRGVGFLFKTIAPKYVAVPARTTPEVVKRKDATQPNLLLRRTGCRAQALCLSEHISPLTPSTIHVLLHSASSPTHPIVLYHATRLSTLGSFRRRGINPPGHHNFFSGGPSFNLADTVEAAMAHVLHGKPALRNPQDGRSFNPVMIFQFTIDLSKSRVKNWLNPSQTPLSKVQPELAQWVSHNWAQGGEAEVRTDVDFIIGPFLVNQNGYKNFLVVDYWARGHQPLIHVAAVSDASFALLNRSLTNIYVEQEDDVAPEGASGSGGTDGSGTGAGESGPGESQVE